MILIWSDILILLAAFFNACCDCFENSPNFNESIFKKLDKRFWCKDISWQYAKKIFSYKVDSWHVSKSLMICCIIGAIVIYEPINEWYIDFLSMGIIWNLCFWLFYHKLFRIK